MAVVVQDLLFPSCHALLLWRPADGRQQVVPVSSCQCSLRSMSIAALTRPPMLASGVGEVAPRTFQFAVLHCVEATGPLPGMMLPRRCLTAHAIEKLGWALLAVRIIAGSCAHCVRVEAGCRVGLAGMPAVLPHCWGFFCFHCAILQLMRCW